MRRKGGRRPRASIPQIDVRAAGDLLARAGFALPVADGQALDVRFPASPRWSPTCAHGRDQPARRARRAGRSAGLGSPPPPPISPPQADSDGKTAERFEILYLPRLGALARPAQAGARAAAALPRWPTRSSRNARSARRAARSAARRPAAWQRAHLGRRTQLSAAASSGSRLAAPFPAEIEQQDHVPAPIVGAGEAGGGEAAASWRCRAPPRARGSKPPPAVSPASTLPPGNSHRPAMARPGARCCSSTRPSAVDQSRRHHGHCRIFFQVAALARISLTTSA